MYSKLKYMYFVHADNNSIYMYDQKKATLENLCLVGTKKQMQLRCTLHRRENMQYQPFPVSFL